MYSHPDSAMTLICQMPDSLLSSQQLDDDVRIDIYFFRANRLMKERKHSEAIEWMDKAMNIKRKNMEKELAAREERQVRTPINTFIAPAYLGSVSVLALALLGTILYDRRLRQISSLHSSVQKKADEIGILSSQLQQIHNTTTEQLGRGKQWMDLLEQGKTMKNISIEEEQYFIDYYAFSHPEEYKRITSPYRQLSLRHTTYLILSEMGYNDKDIMRILMVKGSTIRNYRLRMNKNKWE